MAQKIERRLRGVSLIVPAYNEEKGIEGVLKGLIDIMNNNKTDYEIIVVNDGSTDNTGQILKELSDIVVVDHFQNKGYGAALKSGIRKSRYETVVITDADGTYPNSRIPELVEGIGEYDMVVGARTGENVKIPLIRRPAKSFLNILANYLLETKIPDLNSGLRAFRKDTVMWYFNILPDSFSFPTTITLAMLGDGFAVNYIPIDYGTRKGKSKIKARDAFNFLVLIVRTIMYFNPLRVFLPISLGLLSAALIRLGYDIFVLSNITDSSTMFFIAALQVGLIGMLADLVAKKRQPRA